MSNHRYQPDGHHSLTPYFTVNNADKFMEFLASTFEASIIKENRYTDNRFQHAHMKIGDSIIMLNEATSDYPSQISQMHVFVEDADYTYKRALKFGAQSIMEPNVRPHGDRMAGIKDPSDNIWWIATSCEK